MAYPLVSAGTSISVTAEANYASAGEGTVPLIIIGTHDYKTLPSGSGVAEGTLPENANTLYPITSQRELLQTFGNPIFYKKNGSSIHGYELNEFGLHAAYQYLGVANRAYVIRAAIDYAQLVPRASQPRSEPPASQRWLDTQNNTWGIYEYTGAEWAERDLWIVDDALMLDDSASEIITGQKVPKITAAVAGDFAMVVLYGKKVLYQLSGSTWNVVGTPAWKTAKIAAGGASDLSLSYNTYLPVTGSVGSVLILETPPVVTSTAATTSWQIKTYNATTGAWDQTLAPVYSVAREAQLTKIIDTVYLSHEDSRAVFEFRRYNGTAWVALGEIASSEEPSGDAGDGTLWYDNTLSATIKICHNGAWVDYASRYPTTSPDGVIFMGSAPKLQSDGTPLVSQDLWIDTSDLENYPKMYRYSGGSWIAIDVEDGVNPLNGIVFSDSNDISAVNFPEGMKLFDLATSTNDVKSYDENTGRWVNVSGLQTNGVPFFGRKAQRQMIVRAMAATISSNENIRAETINFNLLAAPGYIELVDEMVTLNTDMKETAFIVADTPARLKPTGLEITKFANNASGGNTERGTSAFNAFVGMYYPWGLGTNVDGQEIMVPPSTIALRTLAFSDSISYPWMAPAGYTRGLVTNASTVGYLDDQGEFKAALLNQGQRDVLYSNKINPIAYIPNKGLVIYGQKTRHSLETSLDRINVARLINYLRYNLDNISKAFLFEPNDLQTRDSIKTSFERFLSDLVGLRGLYDFIVVCDESNNTAERIDRHELWVDIAIQPMQTVEFIYIPVRIVATGDDLGSLI